MSKNKEVEYWTGEPYRRQDPEFTSDSMEKENARMDALMNEMTMKVRHKDSVDETADKKVFGVSK